MTRTNTAPLKTAQWQALRTFVATRANFRCESCFAYTGMHGEADHIQPRAQEHVHGIHVYDHTNLQWLCPSCHSAKTNAERREAVGGAPGEVRDMATRPPNRTNLPGRDKFMSAAGIPEIPAKRRKPKC